MRTTLLTQEVSVTPGALTVIEIEVVNAATVIDGITARVEGVDPSWVQFPTPVLSLFPESSGILPIHVNFPPTTVVGSYLMVVHVESTIDPTRTTTHDLWLQVEPQQAATLRLRPSLVTGGRDARFGVLVSNTGNVPSDFTIAGVDETKVVNCRAEPLTLSVHPGLTREADLVVEGPRPWFGQPVSRNLAVTATAGTLQLRQTATFTQRPRIPRGLLTVLILALIVALWAAIFLLGARLLRDDALPTKAVATNFNTGGVQGVPLDLVAGSVGGRVTATSNGQGLARTTVEAFRERPDGSSELATSAATADDGTYALTALLPGHYSLRFTSEGFAEVWYPAAAVEAEAEAIHVKPRAELTGRNAVLTGNTGTLRGDLALPPGADPNSPVTVTVTQVVEQATGEGGAPVEPPPPIVQQVDGPIAISGLETPAKYTVLVESPDFDPQQIDVALVGGEQAVLNTVRLGAARGGISGRVVNAEGTPLGNVEVVATSGEFVATATTPTTGNVGAFQFNGLETPRTYVLTFTSEGFGTTTMALELGAGQSRTDFTATLNGGNGALSGTVRAPGGNPLGGVDVLVTRADLEATTATLTTAGPGAGVGSFRVGDLPAPGTYAVTFSAEGYLDETVLVEVAAPGARPTVDVTMRLTTATISGTVTGTGARLVGATVELSDGLVTRSTSTASTPTGGYTFGGVAPGSYTVTARLDGRATRVALVQVTAGAAIVRNLDLPEAP